MGMGPSMDTDPDPGMGTDMVMGMDTDPGMGTDPGTGPGMGMGTGTGTGPGTGPGMGMEDKLNKRKHNGHTDWNDTAGRLDPEGARKVLRASEAELDSVGRTPTPDQVILALRLWKREEVQILLLSQAIWLRGHCGSPPGRGYHPGFGLGARRSQADHRGRVAGWLVLRPDHHE